MRKVLVLVLLVFIMATLTAESVNSLVEKGILNFEDANYAEARDYFLNAIDKSGVKTPEHCYWLGKSYVALQDYEKAYEMFEYFSKNHLGQETQGIGSLLNILKREIISADTSGVYFTLGRLPYYMNSGSGDSAPVLSGDENEIYFTSERATEDENENIWKSTKVEGKWALPVLVEELSTINNEAIASITEDGEKAYLFGNYVNNNGMGDIYVCQKLGQQWSKPQKIENISSGSVEMHPYVYNDSIMFFTSVNKQCYGGSDLYVSEKSKEYWSEPINLGPVINTIEYEQTPFLDFDGKTLYFASNGHPGFGGFDIFKSTKIGDSWQDWSEPKNVGVRINSVRDDRYFMKERYSNIGYISSTRAGGMGGEDIYTFSITRAELPEQKKERPNNIYVFGKVSCETIPTDELNISEFGWDYYVGEINYREMVKVDSVGNYRIPLIKGADSYSCTVVAENCFTLVNTIIIDDEDESFEYNILLSEIIEDQVYEISDINFEFNKAILTENSFSKLDELVMTLKNNTKYFLEINGHTDNIGTNNYNLKLSTKRAQSVVNYLIKAGINEERLIALGYGEEQPKDTNETEKGRSVNRRVEMKFSKDKELSEMNGLQDEIIKLRSKMEIVEKELKAKKLKMKKVATPNVLKKSEASLEVKEKTEKVTDSSLKEEKTKDETKKSSDEKSEE